MRSCTPEIRNSAVAMVASQGISVRAAADRLGTPFHPLDVWASKDPTRPGGPYPPYRVMRGSSWLDGHDDMCSHYRFRYPDGNGNDNFGYRVVRSP